MATRQQLEAESYWGDELAAPALVTLGAKIRAHYGLSVDAVGVRGDTEHLYGYHRSRRWVKNSRYCINRTYSVSETESNRTGGDSDWVCALDLTLPRAELIAACQRLDKAVRAGELEKIAEWFGNDDGDNRVDGYDNIRNRVASADDSHLWHLHLSFQRGRANEDHTDVFNVLTGADMALRDDRDFANMLSWVRAVEAFADTVTWTQADGTPKTENVGIVKAVNDLAADLNAVKVTLANMAATDQVDEQAVADAVLAGLGTLDAQEAADALRAVLTPSQVAALAAALTATP